MTYSLDIPFGMSKLGTDETAATLEAVYVLFDLKKRQGVILSDELRDMASKHMIQPQDS